MEVPSPFPIRGQISHLASRHKATGETLYQESNASERTTRHGPALCVLLPLLTCQGPVVAVGEQ